MIVQEALQDARILAPWEHHGDLDVRSLHLMDVFAHGAGDVAVEALLDVERDTQHVPYLGPLLGEACGRVRIDGRVQSADVRCIDRPRVPDRLQHASVQPVDQDDRLVPGPGRELHTTADRMVAGAAVVPNHHHADALDRSKGPDQARPGAPSAKASHEGHVCRTGDDDRYVEVIG